jgi:CDP-diacylglycerol--glycerol-3-phosphate 3-phosphatidyltransferase
VPVNKDGFRPPPDRFRSIFPYALLWSRLAISPVFPLVAWLVASPWAGRVLALLLLWAVVSDIFDGILARRWGVSTTAMRRWDSNVDTVFWLAAIGTLVASHHAWFLPKWPWLALVLALEALTYIVSWVRFHKEPATHSLAAKFWSLLLFALLVECSLTGTGDIFWYPCLAGAILVRLEVIAILLILREWASDVPHFKAALTLRHGQTIQRNKWLNG